jgi:hypothetical protein
METGDLLGKAVFKAKLEFFTAAEAIERKSETPLLSL